MMGVTTFISGNAVKVYTMQPDPDIDYGTKHRAFVFTCKECGRMLMVTGAHGDTGFVGVWVDNYVIADYGWGHRGKIGGPWYCEHHNGGEG